ncbi:MAG: hypothetical protein IPH75_13135 [bacterium]|nr:hypothetical protein [bacterium]
MHILQSTLRLASLMLLTIFLLPVLSTAQEEAEFGVYPMSGPEGILLVIQGQPLHPTVASQNSGWVGYHIYRKADSDTSYIRITSQPVSRVGSLEELEAFAGGPIDGLERLVGLTTKQELWQRLAANDSSAMILGIFSRSFYEAMGLLRWDRLVEKGKAYSYRATRVDKNGKESEASEPVSATYGTPPFSLLGPLDPQIANTKKGVELTWQRNPDDSGGMSYSVYRTPDLEGSFIRLNRYSLILTPDSATGEPRGTFVDTTASQGHGYYYAVVSTDYAGNESTRDKVLSIHVADLLPPPIPQNVFADPDELGITIRWDKVDDPATAGYYIYRSLDPDSNYIKITESLLPYDTGWYMDRTATVTDRVFYRVSAVDQSGNESAPSARALSLYENYVVPLPPQEVRAMQSDSGVVISWIRNEEPDLQGYYLFRADNYGGELTQISPLIPPDTLNYRDSSDYLSPRGEYWYLVQAINFTGITSQYSVPVAVSPSKEESPEQVLAFWGYYEPGAGRLFWRAPDDNMVAGYNLYRTTTGDTTQWILLNAKPLDRTVGEYRDTLVSPNQFYRYRICSVDPKGLEGDMSHIVSFVTFESVAPPPGGLRVVSTDGTPKLIWNQSQLKEIVGYRIYRRQDNIAMAIHPQMLPATANEYQDTTAQRGMKYYYSISSVDSWGRESERSPEIEYLVR